MSEKNKALVSRIPLEAFNQGKLEVIDEVIADNSVEHSPLPPGMPTGKEGLKALIKALRSAFPDYKVTIDLQVTEGDLVVQRATTTGTMKGEFAGMPPSGKKATIVEHWGVQDQLGMLQQLGFIPAPEAAAAR